MREIIAVPHYHPDRADETSRYPIPSGGKHVRQISHPRILTRLTNCDYHSMRTPSTCARRKQTPHSLHTRRQTAIGNPTFYTLDLPLNTNSANFSPTIHFIPSCLRNIPCMHGAAHTLNTNAEPCSQIVIHSNRPGVPDTLTLRRQPRVPIPVPSLRKVCIARY